jgi:hypothetical protein
MNSTSKPTRETTMRCDDCNATIEPDELREHLGRKLCEDCYMVACSPMKTCDPWAVHSAKTYEQHAGDDRLLTPLQKELLQLLKDEGPLEPSVVQQKLEGRHSPEDLERAFAALRHMEKVRGEKQGQRVLWRLW